MIPSQLIQYPAALVSFGKSWAFRSLFPCILGLILSGTGLIGAKEISLVTKQPIGEMAVAGRLSIDLHAEFMVSREFGTETVLNWYNCGYSGGGRGGTTVGGDFGDFGFQVGLNDRQARCPHAITINSVRAVHFDGNDFLKSNIAIEPRILESGKMALEIWFRSKQPSEQEVLIGWENKQGTETSAPVALPSKWMGGENWHHLVVNCDRERESWYLDGKQVSSGPRQLLPKAGHVMVLGGSGSRAASFNGDLAAVRLHDQSLSEAQIACNFAGGVALGTEIHPWWRLEPDKWLVRESKHFRYCVDKGEMKLWTFAQVQEFEKRLPKMFELAELTYHLYSERLAMRSSVVSFKPEERGDGIKYSIPIQPNPGSMMGCDGSFGWAYQDAGFMNPPELVRGFQCMTGGMAGNFSETHANFLQTYLGIYQTIPLVLREASIFPSNGRHPNHDRTMFEHLAQSPEYGPMFISKLWYDGPAKQGDSPNPWVAFQEINPHPERSFADEYLRMVMRNVTWDYQTFLECVSMTDIKNGLRLSKENLYLKAVDKMAKMDISQPHLRSKVRLEPIANEPNWWRVPKDQAPQQLGWNLCPLTCRPGPVSATLVGYRDESRGGDWRAGFVGVDSAGRPVYGEVFRPGQMGSFQVGPEVKELYLAVAATPTKLMEIPMSSDYRSVEQAQFPYKVELSGCEPMDVQIPPQTTGHHHSNGGGLVVSPAQVAPSVYVAPNARVVGHSKVFGSARIEDYATVQDATVQDAAVLSGHALVCEDSIISGAAKVRDFAVVRGRTTVSGNAKVLEHAVVNTGKVCSGNVVIKGLADVYGGSLSGSPMIDGNYAKANDISGGKWFTWSSRHEKNPGETEENFGGLYADYDFETPHEWMVRDAFGVTWGYLEHGAKIEKMASKNGGKPGGVLRLNGKDQFVALPRDVADFADCTFTAEVFWDGANEGAKIFEFSNPNGDAIFLSPSLGGKLLFALRKGSQLEALSAAPLAPNTWASIQVMFRGDTARLYLNGTKVAERYRMLLRPDKIGATRCYLGRGATGGFFGGDIGRFTIHSAALINDAPPTPNPAAFQMKPFLVAPNSIVMAAQPGADPLERVEYWFEAVAGNWNSGWVKEPVVRVESRLAGLNASFRVKMRNKLGIETRFSEPMRTEGFTSQTRLKEVTASKPTVVEAEDFVANVPSADGSCKWEKQTQPAGFVGQGVMVVPDRGGLSENFDLTTARLDYALKFPQAGRYFLWVRGNGNNDGGQSIHVSMGLKFQDWGKNLRTGWNRYAWTRSPAFEVSEPGQYLFSIGMREDGAVIDRFVITSDENFKPSPHQCAPDGVMIGEGPR